MKTTHPATPAFNAFGIIGLGLIGGSLAKALRAFVPGCRITVADLRPEPVHAALAEGVADEAARQRTPKTVYGASGTTYGRPGAAPIAINQKI